MQKSEFQKPLLKERPGKNGCLANNKAMSHGKTDGTEVQRYARSQERLEHNILLFGHYRMFECLISSLNQSCVMSIRKINDNCHITLQKNRGVFSVCQNYKIFGASLYDIINIVYVCLRIPKNYYIYSTITQF